MLIVLRFSVTPYTSIITVVDEDATTTTTNAAATTTSNAATTTTTTRGNGTPRPSAPPNTRGSSGSGNLAQSSAAPSLPAFAAGNTAEEASEDESSPSSGFGDTADSDVAFGGARGQSRRSDEQAEAAASASIRLAPLAVCAMILFTRF